MGQPLTKCLRNGGAKQKSVRNSSKNGNHSKTAVKDLLFLAQRNFVGGSTLQLATIESKVTRFTLTIVLVECEEFDRGHAQENLDIDTKANGINRTENVRVGVRITRQVNASLLDQNTNNSQHAAAKDCQK